MRMTKSDVLVEELEPDLCECGQDVTHSVNLDLRALGMAISVEPYCARCANAVADRLRATLPDDEEDLVEHEDLVDQRVTITDAGRAALRCFHLADSDEPAPNLSPERCPRCGLYFVDDDGE